MKSTPQVEAQPYGGLNDDVVVGQDATTETPREDETTRAKKDGLFQSRAKAMARNPWTHLFTALILSIAISVIGFVAGNFSVTADNAGWQSRGTLISDRQTQALLVLRNEDRLAEEGESAWNDLINNVQPGWETDDDADPTEPRRLQDAKEPRRSKIMDDAMNHRVKRSLPFTLSEELRRRLQTSSLGGLGSCNSTWYTSPKLTTDTHLWPVWETREEGISALEPSVIKDICVAEQNTNAVLAANGLCKGCSDGSCLPPYSIVLLARLMVGDDNFALSCADLATEWESTSRYALASLKTCVSDIKAAGNQESLPGSCPDGFSTALVDELFGENNDIVRYTSSIFATKDQPKDLYAQAKNCDGADGSSVVSGAYDTQNEDFIGEFADAAVGQDMILAMGSAFITSVAILLHTRSPWLTLIGLAQIILSFPLAYFVYTFIGQLDFFPFLNFIGVFVVFALGADDIFVAVDKWKNARIANKDGSVEEVAAKALPDAAGAMFLTTLTTAVAFFATAICPVAPLKCFAVFNGLLIVFDYFMCVLIVFPALCLYDKWQNNGCCMRCCVTCNIRCKSSRSEDETGAEAGKMDDQTSLIHRILLGFYKMLHVARWPLLAVCIGALIWSAVVAASLELPNSSDVRVLNANRVEYERNYEWRQKLLYSVLDKNSGSDAVVIWGVKAADTGNQNNPDSWSQLVLDNGFDPSSEDSQLFLLRFCEDLFKKEFASVVDDTYICPIQAFNTWLAQQSVSPSPTQQYMDNCNGATGVGMPSQDFHQCISSWSSLVDERSILSRNGVVEIMYIRCQSRVRYDSSYDALNKEWNNIEDYLSEERRSAPAGVNNMYHTSQDFWWYDTNGSMLRTAISAAGIALAAAGAVVLFSSRSIMLTIFSVFTIGYVLCATTAMLVASGWTLGFLESVCFAILIGISCDFVIHFGHAYAKLEGDTDRHERTKFALLTMGPSILAAAFTTISSAAIMLFTIITFFQKFAIILFYTVIQATIGSFVVYLTLAETLGPARPTYTVDWIVAKIRSRGRNAQEGESPKGDDVDSEDIESADGTEKLHYEP